MIIPLDVLLEKVPREVAQAKLALVGADVKKVDGIEDLGLGHVNVDGAKVFGEAVADEDAAEVEEEPEFLVSDFEGDEVVVGAAGVEVAFL